MERAAKITFAAALPANVEYYDPAKHDYDPANPGKFSVFPRADPGADLGRFHGANGFAVVSGGKVVSYVVAHGDTLTGISKRFSIDAGALTRDAKPVIPDETQIDPGDALVLPDAPAAPGGYIAPDNPYGTLVA